MRIRSLALRVPAALHVVMAALLLAGSAATLVIGMFQADMPVSEAPSMLTFGAVLAGIYAAPGLVGWRATNLDALPAWRAPAATVIMLVSIAILALVPWTFLFPGEPDGQTALVVLVPIPSCLVATVLLLLLTRRPVVGVDDSA